jgi:hypothetical protein
MRLVLAFLAFAFVPLLAGAQQQRGILLMAEGRDNIMQNWEVPREKWDAQPKWIPTSNAPLPLSISKAVELGEAWLRKRHSDISKVALSQITLRIQSQSGADTRDGWFYRVEFQPVIAGRKLWGGELVAVVLLDGTVVAPRTEPYTSGR